MQTDAISASETSTFALMSNAVTRPMTASKMMGMPQRMIAAHEASNGKGTRSKMLTISAMPEITSSVISFFVPPSSKKMLQLFHCRFHGSDYFLYHRGYWLIIHMGV